MNAHSPAVTGHDQAILIVDDDPVSSRLISGLIETRGCGPVAAVRTLADAGHAIAIADYRAAIVDLHLPDGNGMEFVHLARRGRRSRNRSMLIVVCSAYAAERTTRLLERLGADVVLAKPPDPATLLSRIEAVLPVA